MVEQADVYVRNISTGDVRTIRKLSDGSSDIDVTINPGDEEKILLPSTEESLIISPPSGWIINDCSCEVKKGADFMSCSENASNWIIKIQVPNDAVPEVPNDVNIDISGPPPAPTP